MKYRIITIVAAVFLIAVSGLASADILPKPVPENQLFTMDSIIEAVGPVSEKTTVVWNIGDAGLDALANPRLNAANGNVESGSIAYVTYSDSIVTNGGQLSEVKHFEMSTGSKTEGMYNIETTKVLTYTSQNGSHLMGEESYVLDVAGNWRAGLDGIVCVFSRATNNIIPAFCNKVTASSKLTQVTTAQVETVGALTAVSDDQSTPAALKYEIAVAPDSNSASGYADGIVSTTFTVSVMEGRSDTQSAPGVDGRIIPGRARTDGSITCNLDQSQCNQAVLNLAAMVGAQTGRDTFTLTLQNPGVWTAGDTITGTDTSGTGLVPVWTMTIPVPGTTIWVPNLVAQAYEAVFGANYGPNILAAATGGVYADGNTVLTGLLSGTVWQFTPGQAAVEPVYPWANELASRLTYIDTATVSGGISTFNKVFDYKSGVACENC